MTVTLPKELVRPKPPHGDPCNRCGLCCARSLCAVGERIFGYDRAGPCPALKFAPDGVATCGVIESPSTYAPEIVARSGLSEQEMAEAAKIITGRGVGCDAVNDGEEPNKAFDREMARRGPALLNRMGFAIFVWGIRI